MTHSTRHQSPLFGTAPLWVARVLAWVGFGVSAYLAWTSIGQLPIAGCSGTGLFDCDAVHSSTWSHWLNVPVAIPGLACYASLAGLSVLLGWRKVPITRWVNTVFIGLAFLVGGAAVWFAALQLGLLGKICPACMAMHLCGIVLAGLALWGVFGQLQSSPSTKLSNPSLMALRCAAVPAGPPATRSVIVEPDGRPSLGYASGGAFAVLTMLVAGQILFPAKEFSVETVELDTPIDMSGSEADESIARGNPTSMTAQPHQVMRLPSNDSSNDSTAASTTQEDESKLSDESDGIAEKQATSSADSPSDDLFGDNDVSPSHEDKLATSSDGGSKTAKPRERIVTLLGGKLSLDVYKYPVLGSPEAPYVVVEMISYDCPHCRKMHRVVEEARKRFGDELAVVVLPVPLEKSCNKYVTNSVASHRGSCTLARYAMAVAEVDPKAFKKFHDWLMADEDKVPTIEQVISKAGGMVNGDRLREAKNSDALNAKIKHNVELFAALQKQHNTNRNFGLPVQIVGSGVMSGAATADAVSQMWAERLGIKPL